jgi:hypothetical protein
VAQVVDREEAVGEEFVGPEEVGEVAATEAAAGAAVAGGIDGTLLVKVPRVAQVDPTTGHPGLAITRDSRGEDGVEEVNAAHDRVNDVER